MISSGTSLDQALQHCDLQQLGEWGSFYLTKTYLTYNLDEGYKIESYTIVHVFLRCVCGFYQESHLSLIRTKVNMETIENPEFLQVMQRHWEKHYDCAFLTKTEVIPNPNNEVFLTIREEDMLVDRLFEIFIEAQPAIGNLESGRIVYNGKLMERGRQLKEYNIFLGKELKLKCLKSSGCTGPLLQMTDA